MLHTHKCKQDYDTYHNAINDHNHLYKQWFENLKIIAYSSIEYHCFENWSQLNCSKVDNVFYFILNGSGTLKTEKSKTIHNYNAGDLITLEQGLVHTIIPHDECDLIVVHFESQLPGGLNLLHLANFPTMIKNDKFLDLKKIFTECSRDFALKTFAWKENIEANILKILLNICRHYGDSFACRAAIHQHKHLSKISPLLKWIDKNHSNPEISSRLMAKHIHVSEVYLRKLFKNTLGISPINFLQRRRLETACKMLKQNIETIEIIAHHSGFQNTPFFYRVFKKWMGQTPKAYKSNSGL